MAGAALSDSVAIAPFRGDEPLVVALLHVASHGFAAGISVNREVFKRVLQTCAFGRISPVTQYPGGRTTSRVVAYAAC